MITVILRLSTVLLLLLMLAAIMTGNPIAVVTAWVGFAALAVVRAP
jgi:hypothetical protein